MMSLLKQVILATWKVDYESGLRARIEIVSSQDMIAVQQSTDASSLLDLGGRDEKPVDSTHITLAHVSFRLSMFFSSTHGLDGSSIPTLLGDQGWSRVRRIEPPVAWLLNCAVQLLDCQVVLQRWHRGGGSLNKSEGSKKCHGVTEYGPSSPTIILLVYNEKTRAPYKILQPDHRGFY